MKIVYNTRDNGACPFCMREKDCILKKQMSQSLEELHSHGDDDFEVVIYRCPNFHAKEE